MKLLLLILLFACSTEPEDVCGVEGGDGTTCADCAGLPNGDSIEDNCGVCDDDLSNDCVPDCAGVWGGILIEDGCGLCDGDNSTCADCAGIPNGDSIEDNCGVCDTDLSNDCVPDCVGVWGGSTVEDCAGECGGTAINICEYCIPFDDTNIVPDFYLEYFTDDILSDCTLYNDSIYVSTDVELPFPCEEDDNYFYEGAIGNSVLISAPHAQRTYRLSDEHPTDLYTGAFARLLHEKTGCTSIIKHYKSDDPNYYDFVPEGTLTDCFEDSVNVLLPYKQKILTYLESHPEIKLVIDLHGWSDSGRTGDIDLGTMNGESLESAIGNCLPEIISYIFVERWSMSTSFNSYPAYTNQTITKFVNEYIEEEVDAIQFEIESEYRGCGNETQLKMIYALMEVIHVSNYLYGQSN